MKLSKETFNQKRMIIVLGWSIAYLKGIQIDFPQIIVRDDRFVARSPNDFSCSLGSSQRTNKEENLKSQEVIITSNAKKQWKVKKKKKPGEACIEVVVDEHLARSLGLRLTLLGENREIGASLDPAFGVPRALAVPHQNHPLRRPYQRE